MKIALIGATGSIGSRIFSELLSRKHEVTAIARDPSKVTAPGVKVLKADVLQADALANVIAGHDAVVSAVSPSGGQALDAVLAGGKALVAAAKQSGTKRVIVVGGAGSLWAAPGLLVIDAPSFPADWKPIAQAHADLLAYYKTVTDIDWTYFSPPALIEPGTRTGTFRLGLDDLVTDAAGQSRISSEDYAVALVDELESPRHIRKRFTIAY